MAKWQSSGQWDVNWSDMCTFCALTLKRIISFPSPPSFVLLARMWMWWLELKQVSSGCCSVVSASLQSYGLQHARPPCPSPPPRVCPSSCPSHQWCHPDISFSDALFSFFTKFSWLALPSSCGSCFVRTLHSDLFILGGLTQHGL